MVWREAGGGGRWKNRWKDGGLGEVEGQVEERKMQVGGLLKTFKKKKI